MCGIVAYFGGAGNNLTRVLTAMSAIIYRAPDSTGVAFFGDDREPIRARKSLGSVRQLVEVLHDESFYPNPERLLLQLWGAGPGDIPPEQYQRSLLEFEGFPEPQESGPREGYPGFDELVDLKASTPKRLVSGSPGRPDPLPVLSIQSEGSLKRAVLSLISQYDLSSVVIQSLIRKRLSEALMQAEQEERLEIDPSDVLDAFDELFEKVTMDEGTIEPRRADYGWNPRNPYAEKYLWHYLGRCSIEVPSDYDRDGVCCVFRLLDAALLSRLPHNPRLYETLQDRLESLWPDAQRVKPVDWRTLYRAEKRANVYGRAASTALAYLQREELVPALKSCRGGKSAAAEGIVYGQTDPISLRYFASPILSQGRWALQAPVTIKNAHPFFDGAGQRVIVLNGHFNAQVEGEVREFLENVAGSSFRSRNSSEYFALLWEYYYELLHGEQRRYEAIRKQIEAELTAYGLGSQSIDYQIFHRVMGKSSSQLDEMAFLEAARRMVRNGGQIAVAGMSLLSGRRIYVAAHDRPVFVARRTENDDFMVVSDINAAMGLFPQAMINEKTNKLRNMMRHQLDSARKLRSDGSPIEEIRALKHRREKAAEEVLEDFRVEVYPLQGEEIFARVETGFSGGRLTRDVTIMDFDGSPLPTVEPFSTVLNPLQIGEDFYGSFYETHLHEIPDRLDDILRVYLSEESGLPQFRIRERYLRRHFGRSFSNLKRMVLVGMGSAFHVGLMAKPYIQKLLPEMDVVVLQAVEIDDISNNFVQERDLVILLSWSGTTGDVVQVAKELRRYNMMMIAITEKRFADIGLIAQKSGGVVPVLSGEEVTVPGLKSTMCMLFALELLSAWFCSRMGDQQKALEGVERLQRVPQIIQRALEDEEVENFCQWLATASARSYAAVVIDALKTSGTGREIALKLEEASWTAIGKALDYRDVFLNTLNGGLDAHLVIVNATHGERFPEAEEVMERLYQKGIPFAATVSDDNWSEAIAAYAEQWISLPEIEGELQPFVDLTFFYRLAYEYGLAHGRSSEDFPRNRAKSITAGSTPPKQTLSPPAELFHMDRRYRDLLDADRESERLARESSWEREAEEEWQKAYYRRMRRLARALLARDPLESLLASGFDNLDRLASAIFEDMTEEGEMVLVPLDRLAESASRNVVEQWRRLLGFSMRTVSPMENLESLSDETMVVLTASTVPDSRSLEEFLPRIPRNCVWIGPKIHGRIPRVFEEGLGYLPLRNGSSLDGCDQLYAALCSLFVELRRIGDSRKAEIVSRQLRQAPAMIRSVLNSDALRREIWEAMAANRAYKSAFFVGPPGGTGLFWLDRFDRSDGMVVEHHLFGESVHGPLVTVDPRVQDKFVEVTPRDRMVAAYGAESVSAWESRYLRGKSVDSFLTRSTGYLSFGAAPFFAQGSWFLPELKPGYDAAHDNLIMVDATSDRHFARAVDELATYGCRYARLVVISQEAFQHAPEKKSLYKYPISHLVFLPSLEGEEGKVEASELILPFAMNLLGTEMAVAGSHQQREESRHSSYRTIGELRSGS